MNTKAKPDLVEDSLQAGSQALELENRKLAYKSFKKAYDLAVGLGLREMLSKEKQAWHGLIAASHGQRLIDLRGLLFDRFHHQVFPKLSRSGAEQLMGWSRDRQPNAEQWLSLQLSAEKQLLATKRAAYLPSVSRRILFSAYCYSMLENGIPKGPNNDSSPRLLSLSAFSKVCSFWLERPAPPVGIQSLLLELVQVENLIADRILSWEEYDAFLSMLPKKSVISQQLLFHCCFQRAQEYRIEKLLIEHQSQPFLKESSLILAQFYKAMKQQQWSQALEISKNEQIQTKSIRLLRLQCLLGASDYQRAAHELDQMRVQYGDEGDLQILSGLFALYSGSKANAEGKLRAGLKTAVSQRLSVEAILGLAQLDRVVARDLPLIHQLAKSGAKLGELQKFRKNAIKLLEYSSVQFFSEQIKLKTEQLRGTVQEKHYLAAIERINTEIATLKEFEHDAEIWNAALEWCGPRVQNMSKLKKLQQAITKEGELTPESSARLAKIARIFSKHKDTYLKIRLLRSPILHNSLAHDSLKAMKDDHDPRVRAEFLSFSARTGHPMIVQWVQVAANDPDSYVREVALGLRNKLGINSTKIEKAKE